MSSFINKAMGKIEATLDKNSNKSDNAQSSNYGPHGSTQAHDQYRTTGGAPGMASSNTYGSNTNTSGYDNPMSANAGPHSSNYPRVDSDRDGRSDPTSHYGGVGNTQTYGDNLGQTRGPGGLAASNTGYGDSTGTHSVGYSGASTGHTDVGAHGTHTTHAAHTTQAIPGSTGTTDNVGYTGGSNTYDDPRSTNTGPHRSNFANKLDPRVDSNVDNRGNPTSRVDGYGGQTDTYNTTSSGYGGAPTGNTGYASTPGNTGYTGGSNTYDDPRSTNVGPHKSNLVNKMDPRVDSDVDNRGDPTSRVGGYGGQTDVSGSHSAPGGYGVGAGTTAPGYGSGSTRMHEATTTDHGVHGSHGTHGTRGAYGTSDTYEDSSFTPGSGNAQKTAGPHNSDMMNKLDPRVDSNLDGSKTYGGNRTHY